MQSVLLLLIVRLVRGGGKGAGGVDRSLRRPRGRVLVLDDERSMTATGYHLKARA